MKKPCWEQFIFRNLAGTKEDTDSIRLDFKSCFITVCFCHCNIVGILKPFARFKFSIDTAFVVSTSCLQFYKK